MEPSKEQISQEKKPPFQKGVLPQDQKQDAQRGQSGIGADKNDLETHTQSDASKKSEYQAPAKQANDQAKQL